MVVQHPVEESAVRLLFHQSKDGGDRGGDITLDGDVDRCAAADLG
jgi:hypothetical protein